MAAIETNSFGFLVNDLARLIRLEFDRCVAEAGTGITPGEARTLAHVARAGTVRQAVIAERMGVEAMTVTAFIDRLEAKGLVTRSADPSDRRAKLVSVTHDAGAVLDGLKSVTASIRATASAGVSARQWDAFLDTLERTRDNLARARGAAQEPAA